MLANAKIYLVSSERGWSRSLSPHPVNSLRNSEEKEDLPKPINEAELSQPSVLPLRQQPVLATSTWTVPETPFETPLPFLTEDHSQPPPLPPRLPKAAPGSNVSRNAMLDVENAVSGNKEKFFTAEKSKPNLKLGQFENLQHNNNDKFLL